jgi:hypothetical protein
MKPTFLDTLTWFAVLCVIAAIIRKSAGMGTGYHLGLVSRYHDRRGFFPISTRPCGRYRDAVPGRIRPRRHSAAAMVHLFFLLTLPFGMMARARCANIPRPGIVGALLF